MKTYNKSNFFKHTYCIFKEVSPTQLPNQKPDYISKSKSSYYFTEEGVFRKSNHWGRAANCRWKLISDTYKSQNNIIAYARWVDFLPNNDHENLYFIRIDNNNNVSYYHKNEKIYIQSDLLRTSSETAKRIKIINEVLESDSWFKYINSTDYEKLRNETIEHLLFTTKTFIQIKNDLNGKT